MTSIKKHILHFVPNETEDRTKNLYISQHQKLPVIGNISIQNCVRKTSYKKNPDI